MSDDEIWGLTRGGHDPVKVFAAYAAAVKHTGQPTLILPKTVKGYGMGESGEGQMIAHQAKKMTQDALRGFPRPLPDPGVRRRPAERAVHQAAEDSPEMKYLRERRAALGGYLPQRRRKSAALGDPAAGDLRAACSRTAGEREISPRWPSCRCSARWCATRPSASTSCRSCPTSRAPSAWKACSASSASGRRSGQLYKPQDADQLMYYRESKDGQVLQEGINEGGAMSSWIVAATSYSTNNVPMIPFYIYYSMFGLQRVGDLAWLAGDIRAAASCSAARPAHDAQRRGPAARGRPQPHPRRHDPNCISYDPTFAYEVVTIIRDGMRRMYAEQEDVYYYVTLMNENYPHPACPRAARRASSRACTSSATAARRPKKGQRVQLMGSGTILREVMCRGRAAEGRLRHRRRRLERDQLQRAAPRRHGGERWNRLHPTEPRARAMSRPASRATTARLSPPPTTCATTPTRCAEQVQAAGRRYTVLGTDGFGPQRLPAQAAPLLRGRPLARCRRRR
jgi:pyruvate dehydrogenase E1 component